MPSLIQTLFPCLAGGGEEDQPQEDQAHTSAKRKEPTPLTSSNTSAYAAPIPVSEAPGAQKPPFYGPHTEKRLPPKPQSDYTAFELPGSTADFYEMPATHAPGSHPLTRPSNVTATDSNRPSQQSERYPSSPYSTHATLTPGSTAESYYQPSGSVRAASDGDPDEITPVTTNSGNYSRGANPNMYHNVTDALTDRKRMFERLRKTNGGEQNDGSGHSAPQSFGAVTPVEMEAPIQRQAPSELATREHVRKPSAPKELE